MAICASSSRGRLAGLRVDPREVQGQPGFGAALASVALGSSSNRAKGTTRNGVFHETTHRSASVGRSACSRRRRGESCERGAADLSAGDGVHRLR